MRIILVAIFLIFGCVRVAFAYPDGACGPPSGQSGMNYHYRYQKVVIDPDQNVPGNTLDPDVKNGPGKWSLTCSCSSGSTFYTHQWTTTMLPAAGTRGGLLYYRINDYLSVASEIQDDLDNQWYSTPWVNHYLPNGDGGMSCGETRNNFTTGNKVKITLRIDKPFTNTTVINNTELVKLWYTTGPNFVKGSPVATINFSATITVPQNCTIQDGQAISIDFGTLYSGDFNTAGQRPDNAQIQTFQVPVKCTNISSPANLTMRLQAVPDAHYNKAIASSNGDVGVIVTNEQGTILNPDDMSSVVPFQTDISGNANITLKTYPVSTTGKTPTEGVFTALAYLRVDFA